MSGPFARSMYWSVPPASGMAVAISDCDCAAGITTRPARKNASITDGPAILNASPGNTKMPDPIIAPIEIAKTAYRPSDRCSEPLDVVDGLESGVVKVPQT